MHIHPPYKPGSNFKEHFIHFLMLFLAVLLGALAENYRENYIEKNKEREYLSSLMYDLSQDTLRLNSCINSRIEKNKNATKLISLLKTNSIGVFLYSQVIMPPSPSIKYFRSVVL